MKNYYQLGLELRNSIKSLVHNFIKESPDCKNFGEGLKQAVIFRECGLDWGNKEKATSSNQQYWLIGLLRELEGEGLIVQDALSRQWRLAK